MPRKLTKRLLSEGAGIHNSRDFFNEKGTVWISYTPAVTGRASRTWSYQVHLTGYKTDPGGHWLNDGHKTFHGLHVKGSGAMSTVTLRAAVLQEAKDWAAEIYGVTEWAREPFGAWGDAEFVARRTAELQERVKDVELELEVFAFRGFRQEALTRNGNRQTREIVAAKSAAAAKRLMKESSHLATYMGPTGNTVELAVARAKPEQVFWVPLDNRAAGWTEA